MASQRVCDRCKKSVAADHLEGWVVFGVQSYFTGVTSQLMDSRIERDLCSSCVEDFWAWFRRGEDRLREESGKR